MRVEAGVDLVEVPNRSDHQRTAREQNEGHRDLARYKDVAEPMPSADEPPARFAQRASNSEARRLKRGRQAEHKTAEDRGRQGEDEDAAA